MNYNNLSNYYQPPQPQGLNWVQGENAARAWLVAPNNTVILMDSDAPRFYIKSADASGMPSMRAYEYKEAVNTPPQPVDAVTRAEFDALRADIEELKSKNSRRGANKNEPE